jgi:hypothetical protein
MKKPGPKTPVTRFKLTVILIEIGEGVLTTGTDIFSGKNFSFFDVLLYVNTLLQAGRRRALPAVRVWQATATPGGRFARVAPLWPPDVACS